MKGASVISKSKAFTLMELLVTMGITSALLLMLVALISQTTGSYASAQRTIEQISQARAWMQLFESELSCRLPDTPVMWKTDMDDNGHDSDQIAFVRVIPIHEQNPGQPGDLATCCYYVAHDDVPGREPMPKLYRKILDSRETQSLIENGALVEIDSDPSADEPILDGVLKFHTELYFRNPESGSEEIWQPTSKHQPSSLQLTLTIIDSSEAKRFTNASDWKRLAEAPKDSELKLIRTFTHRIRMER